MINITYDYDWFPRLSWLCELMKKFPNRSMLKLQIESMHMYPIKSYEVQRYWLSKKFAFYAADYLNSIENKNETV